MNATAHETTAVLKPLGAGDLIDRSVRFYRKNFVTFLMIASPPVVIGTLLSVGWTLLGRYVFATGSGISADDSAGYYLFVGLGNFAIWITEAIATIVVMGGASRNFVNHLLLGEPLTFRETYRNTSRRLISLIAASTLITIILSVTGLVFFYLAMVVIVVIVAITAFILGSVEILAILVAVVLSVAAALAVMWLFFFIASRFAYVAQVMLVEGQGVGGALSRSFSLASGNAFRLMALFLFSMLATYSALAILYVPLAWYAWGSGVEILTFGEAILPAWYEVTYNLIWQVSFILLTPVWMIGLCLLYVDERVRSEGYDIELMAARRLGDMPNVPRTYVNPLTPAISSTPREHASVAPSVPSRPSSSVLGLD